MNSRDLVLYSYLKGKGGGGGQSAPNICGAFTETSGVKIKDGRYLYNIVQNNRGYYPLTSAGSVPSYDFTKPFKIHLTFSFSTTPTHNQVVTGSTLGDLKLPEIVIGGQSSANLAVAVWAVDDSGLYDYTLVVTKQEMALQANQAYMVDYERDGTNFIFTITDGTNTVTKQMAVAHYYSGSNGQFELGYRYNDISNISDVTEFDLADCYWEEDGVLIWGNKAS